LAPTDPLRAFIMREASQYGALLQLVQEDVMAISQALQGDQQITNELQNTQGALRRDAVPLRWIVRSYPTGRSLASWLRDFEARVTFVSRWQHEADVTARPCWLPGVFDPQVLLVALLQHHARLHRTPIDLLNLRCTTLKGLAELPSSGPSTGLYVHGIFLDGARLDPTTGCLKDSMPRVLQTPLPVVHVEPRSTQDGRHAGDGKDCKDGAFFAPLYRTATRSAEQHAAWGNYVMDVSLHSEHQPSYWALQGVACLLEEQE